MFCKSTAFWAEMQVSEDFLGSSDAYFIITEVLLSFQPVGKNTRKFHTINNYMALEITNQVIIALSVQAIARHI